MEIYILQMKVEAEVPISTEMQCNVIPTYTIMLIYTH